MASASCATRPGVMDPPDVRPFILEQVEVQEAQELYAIGVEALVAPWDLRQVRSADVDPCGVEEVLVQRPVDEAVGLEDAYDELWGSSSRCHAREPSVIVVEPGHVLLRPSVEPSLTHRS